MFHLILDITQKLCNGVRVRVCVRASVRVRARVMCLMNFERTRLSTDPRFNSIGYRALRPVIIVRSYDITIFHNGNSNARESHF